MNEKNLSIERGKLLIQRYRWETLMLAAYCDYGDLEAAEKFEQKVIELTEKLKQL